jgi:small subunit ribosomal protein S2
MGGLLTNLETVKKSIRKLTDIEKMENSGIATRLTKKEYSLLMKEKERLLRDLGGIRDMGVVPQAVFMVDTKKEEIGVAEANRLHIPVVGLIDTNSDPDLIQYPIPGNDDAVKSIKFIATLVTDSILEGRKEYLAGKKAQAQTTAQEVVAA